MTPLEFLKDEFANVRRALNETLRLDYGPKQSRDYFNECENRLTEIEASISNLLPTEADKIGAYLGQLSIVSTLVSQIERSHLGEFSWPFAEEVRDVSKALLTESNLKGDRLSPIIHVVAEGQGYRIYHDQQVPTAGSRRRILIVAFPRSLKHHVLFHTLFGHEIGHTALYTMGIGPILQGEVLMGIVANGPLRDLNATNAWINSANAPGDVKAVLAAYRSRSGSQFDLLQEDWASWLTELICDLFGMILFGPAFFAAHRVYLEPLHPIPHALSRTHPPFAVRYKLLRRVMHLMGWDAPKKMQGADDGFSNAETELLKFLMHDPFDPWADPFDDAGIADAVSGIQKVFNPHASMGYAPLDPDALTALLKRLARGMPPIAAYVDDVGKPMLSDVRISQILYAGWVYWVGRLHLTPTAPFSFFDANRLCDHALLQQRAIRHVLSNRPVTTAVQAAGCQL